MPQSLNKGDFPSTRHGVVDANRARVYLEDILKGIRHLHSLGLVHNDINPANIMLDNNGTAVLIDFDSCRRVGESLGGGAILRGRITGMIRGLILPWRRMIWMLGKN